MSLRDDNLDEVFSDLVRDADGQATMWGDLQTIPAGGTWRESFSVEPSGFAAAR